MCGTNLIKFYKKVKFSTALETKIVTKADLFSKIVFFLAK